MPNREISHEKEDKGRRRFGCRRLLIVILAGLLLICLLAAGLSALSNLTLPDQVESTGPLSALDKARLAEILHLKQELGEAVWPGWGAADIPLLIWNRNTSFLVGFEEAPPDWKPVPNDDFLGQTYFRQPTDDHKNFAVRIGNRWVASMAN